MGTRGAVGFKLNEKLYVTYNHFDSYPKGGLGEEVVKFCRHVDSINGWENLIKNVGNLTLVDENYKPSPEIIEKYAQYANLSVSKRTVEDFYCLLRELQNGRILWDILDGKVSHMIDSAGFMKDSLFCEYAYLIDLDEMELKFFRGFQKTPPTVVLPYLGLDCIRDYNITEKYYPVRLVFSLPFYKLPDNWISS